MKKRNSKKSNNQERSFYEDHLKKTAIELFEWHLVLDYYSELDRKHHVFMDNSDTPDNDRTVYYCEECSKKIINSQEHTYLGLIHNPKDHLFPPQYDYFLRSTIKTKCDEQFHEKCLSFSQLIKKTGQEYSPYFPEDVEKDFASMLLRGTWEDRLNTLKIELHDINSFLVLSVEVRCLSIIYDNFFEYTEKLDMSVQELHDLINSLKDYIMGQTHEMIGYWKLEEKTKKIFSDYGKKSGGREKNEAILSSIIDEIKNDKKTWSAKKLWNYFQRKNNGPENVTDHNAYFQEDPAGQHEIIELGENKGITFDTFRGYVTDARKKINIKKI